VHEGKEQKSGLKIQGGKDQEPRSRNWEMVLIGGKGDNVSTKEV